MKTALLDTNTLVRFLTGEPETQARETAELFASAEQGRIRLLVLPLVVAEVVFVLTGFYRQDRQTVATALSVLLASPGFISPERDRLLHALKLFGSGKLDFVDCYLAAISIAEKLPLVSFDQALGKLHGVTRKSPKDV